MSNVISFPNKIKDTVVNKSPLAYELRSLRLEAQDIIYDIKETSSYINEAVTYHLETKDPITRDLAVGYLEDVKGSLYCLKVLLEHYKELKEQNNIEDMLFETFIKDLAYVENDLRAIGHILGPRL